MTVPQRSRQQLETYYLLYGSAGVDAEYRGHKEDLLAAGCVRVRLGGVRYDRFHDDGHGGLLRVASKAGPGKRGHIRVSYYSNNRVVAAPLPGMRDHFPKVLGEHDTAARAAPGRQLKTTAEPRRSPYTRWSGRCASAEPATARRRLDLRPRSPQNCSGRPQSAQRRSRAGGVNRSLGPPPPSFRWRAKG